MTKRIALLRNDYRVISADCPWEYKITHGRGVAKDHYLTMSMQELIDMAPMVKSWSADNCVLFLWATPPKLYDGIDRLIKAWGFRYVTFGFVWVKVTQNGKYFIGNGRYSRANSEPCLLCVKGKMPVSDHAVNQIIYAYRGPHSRKPEESFEKIERLYPKGPYLEMFARGTPRKGWDCHGNEAVSK